MYTETLGGLERKESFFRRTAQRLLHGNHGSPRCTDSSRPGMRRRVCRARLIVKNINKTHSNQDVPLAPLSASVNRTGGQHGQRKAEGRFVIAGRSPHAYSKEV